jgi:hypothetical protein
VVFVSAVAACGGRSPLGNKDVTSSAPDARSPAPDASSPAPDSLLPVPEAAVVVTDGDASDTQPGVACTQAGRSMAPCPSAEWYAFQGDQRCVRCNYSVEVGCSSTVKYHLCMSSGDGLCYRLCQSNDDCRDPCFPFCRELRLYAGTDSCGASSQHVCLRSDQDTCDPSAEKQ